MPAQPQPRFHSLDALRAAMMLLGLVLHSAVSYVTVPLGAAWPYQDPQTGAGADLLVFFIHLFRMPVFFVVAGFFGAMLYYREGCAGLAANRSRRVLLPLALFWIPLFPLISAGFVFANGRMSGTLDWTPVTSGAFLQQPGLAHLWFLWDLLIFYAAAIIIAPLAERVPDRWVQRFDTMFASVATARWSAIALGAVTALTLLPMSIMGLETSTAFLPPVRVLVAYGVFFAFGWFMFRRRETIDTIGRRWKVSLAFGTIVAVGYLVVTVARPLEGTPIEHLVGVSLAGLSIWGIIFGILGLFVRHLNFPSRRIRYLSDGAYWIYLVHLPFTIWIPGLLAQSSLPGAVKFLIVLVVTSVVTTTTYHFLVRSTAVGGLLNGRRYPRVGAAASQAAEPAGV